VATARGELAQARVHHNAAMADAFHSTEAPIVGHALVGLANLAVTEGRARDAATMLGAATAIRGACDQSLPDLPRVEQATLDALGEEDFAEAHQRGLTYTTMDDVKKLVARSGP
jgi:hypothetical protein